MLDMSNCSFLLQKKVKIKKNRTGVPKLRGLALGMPMMYLVGLPNSGSMLGHCRSPSLVHCRSLVYDTGPTLTLGLHYTLSSTPENTWHSPNCLQL